MIGYLAFRTARGTGREFKRAGGEFRRAPIRDKFWVFVIAAVLMILIGNWVGAGVCAILAWLCWSIEEGRRVQAEAKRREQAEKAGLAIARIRADRKGVSHRSVYAKM